MNNFLVVIPTYNERESIEKVVTALSKLRESHLLSILIVDDGSPDGTANFVDSLGLDFVTVLRRSEKSGLGAFLSRRLFMGSCANPNSLISYRWMATVPIVLSISKQ
jgi:glycosyltransferase involved in cell wall biosynthesis